MNNHDRKLILNDFIAYRMANFASQVSDSCSQIYQQEFGLSIPEWRILARLAENGRMNAKDLVHITFMDKSKVSRTVKIMDEKGLLIKEKVPNDNRATFLSLSQQGNDLFQQLVPKALSWEDQLINCLTASEYRNFIQALEKLEQQANQMK